MNIIDSHTHSVAPGAIVNITPGQKIEHGILYSVGIHPWQLTSQSDFSEVARLASNPQVIAIGETGIDTLCSTPIRLQEDFFIKHIQLSEQLRKPLIIHCVRAHEAILQLHRRLKPLQPWIFHGFRLRPAIASQFIKEKIYLSLGSKFNEQSARIIPDNLLIIETDDEKNISISQVAEKIATARNTSPETILNTARKNINDIFSSIVC